MAYKSKKRSETQEGEGGALPRGGGAGKARFRQLHDDDNDDTDHLKSKFSRTAAAAVVCGRRASLTNGKSELCPRGVLIGMKVAVIGAGVAGLQQGRAFQKRGIDFHIYETEIGVGGVWRTTAHLQGAQGKYMRMSNSSTSCSVRQYRYSANTFPAPLICCVVSTMHSWVSHAFSSAARSDIPILRVPGVSLAGRTDTEAPWRRYSTCSSCAAVY